MYMKSNFVPSWKLPQDLTQNQEQLSALPNPSYTDPESKVSNN